MCGIAGYIGKRAPEQERIAATLPLMKNRGPDAQTFARIPCHDGEVVLLHSRLSIIDLDPRSNQPFKVGNCTVVFNGEIYNYVELRRELEARGIRFRTNSDTEVLVQAYIAWGEKCVERFEGMWAFALFDKEKEILLFSRDRFGEKPLYLFKIGGGLYFGSEVKFVQSLSGQALEINTAQVLRYLVNGYKSLYKTGETFFKGAEEVPYATNITVDNDTKMTARRYWIPRVVPAQLTMDEAIAGFRTRLIQSMKLRLRADVPLAFCLSGGVDSSALVSIAVKEFGYKAATFSILDSDERYNERENIQATVDDLGCANTMIEIPKDGFFERLKQLIAYHDAPISTISYYVHAFLSEAISKGGYRVAVSGTGADEMVTGYYDHFNLYLYEMRNNPRYREYLAQWKTHIAPIVRNPHLKNPELYFNNPNFRRHIYLNNDIFASYLKVPFQEAFVEEHFCDSLLRNRMLNEMFGEVIPVILHEDDLNSMRYSVENRSPYLDTELFQFSHSIPAEYLIQNGYGKYILREAVKGILNDAVRLDRRKKGFNASIQSLLDLKDKNNQEYILSESGIFEFIKRDKIAALIDRDAFPNSESKFLFNFLNARLFLDNSIDGI
ncbi:asparagine synthase (glutamine-hydrolyzing) [Candidatus Uhrbacteria bacterium]|nr:asparagine synthase (glutamine-hydrolyzing) [Candidatus Uhrbacteria bacterium]